MKAIVWTRYGPPDVLQLQNVETPTPKDNEVMIRVHAGGVTKGDCECRSLTFPLWLALPMRLFVGVRKPSRRKILGQELSGVVEAVGKDAKRFQVGDAVFGSTGLSFGAYAEYICLPDDAQSGIITHKPQNMTFDQAATVATGGFEALHFLTRSKLQRGEKILINGAGGSIGTYSVQLAKHLGGHVTAVDRAGKFDMLRRIGADRVLDYAREDFTKRGETYDVILDVVGKTSFAGSMNALNMNGRYLVANPSLGLMFKGRSAGADGNKQVFARPAEQSVKDLERLKELIEAGILKSVIDRRYPLEQTADAHRYVETGQKKGNVVLNIV